jgi:hypothetical protein
MKKEVIYCDVCGKQGAQTLSVWVNRTMDGAGSMENDYETVDLCHEHSISLLKKILNSRGGVTGTTSYEYNQKLVSDIRAKSK